MSLSYLNINSVFNEIGGNGIKLQTMDSFVIVLIGEDMLLFDKNDNKPTIIKTNNEQNLDSNMPTRLTAHQIFIQEVKDGTTKGKALFI